MNGVQAMQLDLERRQAIIDLLSLPDTPDLHRSHRLTFEGKQDRHQMLPHLAAVFVQAKLLDLREREDQRRLYCTFAGSAAAIGRAL
jgi:hypothetical protein